MVLNNVYPKGILGVFMQLDSSANEDEYALALTMTNPSNLYHQVS